MRDYKGRFCKATKFKVGDRVKLTSAGHNEYGTGEENPECEGTVVPERRPIFGWITVDWDNGTGNAYSSPSHLEHVNAAPSPKFAVGDVVAAYGLEWCVESVEANRCLLISRYGRTIHRWSKPEDMKKVPLTAKQRAKRETEIALDVIKQNPAFADKPEPTPAIVPGSVVRLRSGGPDMTVIQIDKMSTVSPDECMLVWFMGETRMACQTPLVCLEFVR